MKYEEFIEAYHKRHPLDDFAKEAEKKYDPTEAIEATEVIYATPVPKEEADNGEENESN